MNDNVYTMRPNLEQGCEAVEALRFFSEEKTANLDVN